MTDHDPGLDDALRDALGRAAAPLEPAVPDPEGLADRILERAASPTARRGTGRGTWRAVGVVGAIAVVGGSLGVALGLRDDGPGGPATTGTEPASTALWRCPGAGRVGQVLDGDRVVLTGRSDDAAWVEVRSPADLGVRVWVAAAAVRADAEVGDLPVVECATPSGVTGTTTTSAAPTDSTTTVPVTTTSVGPTTTVAGPTTTAAAPTTTAKPGLTTTTAPDTTGPTLANLGASPATIWTQEQPGVPCVPAKPQTTTVSVAASDPGGVASARLDWSVNGRTGTVIMSRSGSTWSATVGPFAADTLPTSGAGMNQTVAVTVRVTDAAGNTTTGSTGFQLRSSAECFG